MRKSTISLSYLIASFMTILLLLFYGASQVLAFYQSGADPKNILVLDAASVNDYYRPYILWDDPLRNEGREMEPHTLEKISADYTASYYHQFQALKTGNVEGLHDYFTEKSRDHLEELVEWNIANQKSIKGTSITHNLALDFYSEDGTIATLTDHVTSFRAAYHNEKLILKSYDTTAYRVMLLLEDNFWRIRHKIRQEPNIEKLTTTVADSSIIEIREQTILVDNIPFLIKGMNYYPQDHPWGLMWENYEQINLSEDFSLLTESGFNTLRIFVPYHQFGATQPKEEELEKLKRLLDVAHSHDLKVIVTLFDFFLDYNMDEWTLSDRHLEEVVASLKSHPAILAWDLKNEPDLDFELHGKEEVLDWLNFIAKRIKIYDPNALVTVGWSQPEEIGHLSSVLDFLSFHFYRDPNELRTFLDQHEYSKPLFLGETGMHSFKSWWYPIGHSESDQKNYYSQISTLIDDYQLNYAFWTLYDFPKVPSNVAGKWPWQKKPQKEYGLIKVNGDRKESFELLKAFNQK